MIDWSRAAELRDEIGEDFGEVVDLFLEEVEEVMTRLRSEPNFADLEADLHFLKGSALNLGFCDFSDLCQAGEKMAAMGQQAEIDLRQIVDCYAASRSAFLRELDLRLSA